MTLINSILLVIGVTIFIVSLTRTLALLLHRKKIRVIKEPYGTTKYVISYGKLGVTISASPYSREARLYPNLNDTETLSYSEFFGRFTLHPEMEQILKAQQLTSSR